MAAPKVQSVEQIVKELSPAYQGSIDVIKQRQAQIPGMFNAQRSALDAEKVQGFNTINNQMTGRGLSFGGIGADEQANYLSTKYLPGLQQLAQQENDQRLALTDALAKINQERRLRAIDTRADQKKTLQQYLSEQRQLAWEKSKFSQQMALERAQMAQQASIAAANRAAANPVTKTYSWTKNKAGGYNTSGGVDLATAVKSQGGGLSNLVSLLAAGSASDRKAANQYMQLVSQGKDKQAYSYLVQNTGAFYKGGGF